MGSMFFFTIIEEMIMYENDCYYLTKDTKQFLLILINHYVKILLTYITPCYKKILFLPIKCDKSIIK